MQRMPKRPKRNARFWANVHATLERFPAAFPVTVTVGKGIVPKRFQPAWGGCDKIGSAFFIWLEEPDIELPSIAPGFMDVRQEWLWGNFLHEHAHLLDWSHLHDQHEQPYAQWHGPTWGVQFAKLYQSMYADP